MSKLSLAIIALCLVLAIGALILAIYTF